MLTEKQKKICEKFSAYDDTGHVHCNDCPLVIDKRALMCRANSHYNRRTRNWEPDDVEVEDDE